MRAVTILKDNIDLVVSTSEAVKHRFEFVKSLIMLPNIKQHKPGITARLPELQYKQDEVSCT